eukprot:1146041-Pelagomonas_calceolata.AAC.14
MQLAALVLHLLSPRGKVQRVHDLMPALDARWAFGILEHTGKYCNSCIVKSPEPYSDTHARTHTHTTHTHTHTHHTHTQYTRIRLQTGTLTGILAYSLDMWLQQQQQQPHEPYGQQRIIPAPQTTLAAGAVHRHHRVSSGFGKWIRRSQKMKNCFQWAIQKFKWEIDIFGLKNSGIRNFTPPSPGVKFG